MPNTIFLPDFYPVFPSRLPILLATTHWRAVPPWCSRPACSSVPPPRGATCPLVHSGQPGQAERGSWWQDRILPLLCFQRWSWKDALALGPSSPWQWHPLRPERDVQAGAEGSGSTTTQGGWSRGPSGLPGRSRHRGVDFPGAPVFHETVFCAVLTL